MAGISSSGDIGESFGSGNTQAMEDSAVLEISSGNDSDQAAHSTPFENTEVPPTPSSSELASPPALNVSNKPKWSGFRKLRILVQRAKLRSSKPVKNDWRTGNQGKGQNRGNIFAFFGSKVDKEKRQVFSDPSIMDKHDYNIGELLDYLENDIYKFFKETQDAMVKQLISEFRMAAVQHLSDNFIRKYP